MPTSAGPKPANQRSAARLGAVQALYQMDIGRVSLQETLAQFETFVLGHEVEDAQYLPADVDFFRQIVKGVVGRQLEIDPHIDAVLAEDWHVGRLDATARAVLRSAAFELTGRRDIPAGVVIAEYLEIARAFFDDDMVRFINAALQKLANTLTGETAGDG